MGEQKGDVSSFILLSSVLELHLDQGRAGWELALASLTAALGARSVVSAWGAASPSLSMQGGSKLRAG